MHGENTYPKIVWHYSLVSLIVSIRSIDVVVLSSGELLATTRQYHHPQVVEMNQVTQHLVD
jgi:hypothetical protein